MAVLLNGTNGLIQAYDYQTPATGFSYTFAAGTQTLVMNPATTLAAGTITMPAAPSDGMTITFSSTQQITALTLSGNTGQTVVGAPTQLIANQPLSFVYRATNTTWYANAGGAGRATQVVSGTTVASTSGTAIDFTGIPSWAKRITVMFNGISTNGSSLKQVQIGSGSVTTSGYASTSSFGASSVNQYAYASTGFLLDNNSSSNVSTTYSGAIQLLLIGSNTWIASGSVGTGSFGQVTNACGGNSPALGGALDRVRITTVNGTDAFDAGSINIMYE